jgi:DUF4097 and DUF4098 domain-containing protein YvlB
MSRNYTRNAKMNYSQSKYFLLFFSVIFLFGLTLNAKTLHEKSYKVKPDQMIEVETDLGDVRIRAWENDEVYIKVVGNRKAEEKVDFDFSQNSDGVFVKAEKEGSSWFNWLEGAELKFDIKVPSNFDAYIYTSGGDIFLIDLTGEGELKTSGGDIDIENIEGDFILKTSGGDILVNGLIGDADMGTSGGDINTRDHTGNASAKTSGGDIKLEVAKGKVYASSSGGDITLRFQGNNEGIKLKTSGGDIRMYADSDFSAEANLRTSGGDISVDLPKTRTSRVRSGRYEGEINGGGNLLECRTTGGDITIKEL